MPNVYGPKSDPCVLVAPPPSPPESITVALSSALRSAGQRRNTAEGLSTAQSTESLLGVQCGGRLYPQLARIVSSEVVAIASSRMRVRSIDASTARDALDAGVDLLVTDDLAVVSYAALRDDLLTVRLPWERVYVVLASETVPHGGATRRLTPGEVVADAVRADARIAQPPFWWESSDRCATAVATNNAAPASRSTRVVYPSNDRVAQGLAERLVALAGRRSSRGGDSALGTLLPGLPRAGVRATAAGLPHNEFAAAMRAGDDLAYVLPLPRLTVAPCDEFATLMRAAPWLQSVIPLIDTRGVALVRRGRVGLSLAADGSLRLLDGASETKRKP